MAETIKGINVVIGSDTTGLSAALSDVNKKSKDIQSELTQVQKLLKMNPESTELLAQKQKLLGDAIANTKDKLDKLQTAQEQVNEQFQKGEISEGQYRAFQREVAKTEEDLKGLEKQLQAMKPSFEEIGKKAKEAGEKLSKTGESLTKGVTLPLVAAGAGLVAVGSQFDDAFDKIRVGTGATGKSLEALNEDFRKVAADVPASFDDISTAIADYNTRLGIAGEGLQGLSKQTLELVRITGGDLSKTIEETSQSFQAFNIPAEEYGNALDFIFKTSQSTGIGIDRLQQNMVKFSPALKQLGLDFAESATLLGQLDKSGVDVEQTLSGLTKAVATMAKDGITDANEAIKILLDQIKNAPTDLQGTQAALDTFGAKAGPALASAIREGKLEYQDLLKELQGSQETILGVADETKDWAEGFTELKNNILLALEPLAGKFFGAINDIIPVLKDFAGKIADVIKWFSDLDPGTQKIIFSILALAAAIGPLLIIIGKIATVIGSVIGVIGTISGAIAVVTTGAAAATPAIAGFAGVITALTGPLGIAIAAVAALAAAAFLVIKNWEPIKGFFKGLWESVSNWTVTAWENIKGFFAGIWEWVKSFFAQWGAVILSVIAPFIGIPLLIIQHWNTIKESLAGLWEGIKSIASVAWNGISSTIMNIVTGFVAMISENFQGFFEGIKTVFEGIKTFFAGIWEVIKNIFLGAVLLIIDLVTGNFDKLKSDSEAIWNNLKEAFSQIWEGIKLIFSGALQAISGYISGVWNTIKDISEAIWDGLKIFFTSAWEGIKLVFTNAVNAVKNFMVNAWEGIKQTTENIWNGLKTFFSSTWEGIKSMSAQIWDSIVNGIQSAIKWISEIPNRMVAFGRNIVQGLIDGIMGMINSIKNTIKNLADTVSNGVRNALGIHSPSRVMQGFGSNISEGLAIGIENSRQKVLNAIGGLTKDMTINVKAATSIQSQASSYAERQPVTIHAPLTLTVQGNLDNITLKDVEKAIDKHNSKLMSGIYRTTIGRSAF